MKPAINRTSGCALVSNARADTPLPKCSSAPSIAASAPRNGRCPPQCWFCDSTGQYARQSIRAGNPEAAEVAAVPNPPDTVGAFSGAPVEVRRAAQAVSPAPVASGLSWLVL